MAKDHIDHKCLKARKFLSSPEADQRKYIVKKIIVNIMFIVIDIVVTGTIYYRNLLMLFYKQNLDFWYFSYFD